MDFFTDPASLFLMVALGFIVAISSKFFGKTQKNENAKSKKKEGEQAYQNALVEKEKSKEPTDEKNIDEHIELFLRKTGRIHDGMNDVEIYIARQNFLDETNELSMKKILADIKKDIEQNGTTEIPFDRAMYVLRHYNRRNVISETGQVHIGGIIYKQKEEDNGEDQYISINEANKRSDFNEFENDLSAYKLEGKTVMPTMNPDGSFTVTNADGKIFIVKDNVIIHNEILEDEKLKAKTKLNPTTNDETKLIAQSVEKNVSKNISQENKISQTDEEILDAEINETTQENEANKNEQAEQKNEREKIVNSSNKIEPKKDETSEQENLEKVEEKNTAKVENKKFEKFDNVDMFHAVSKMVDNEKLHERLEQIENENKRLEEKAYKCGMTRAFNKTKFLTDINEIFETHEKVALAFKDSDYLEGRRLPLAS